MEYGCCQVSVAPIRLETSDRSEMVSQLLFGELFEIISKKGNWIEIKTIFDSYCGFIDYKHQLPVSNEEFEILKNEVSYSKNVVDYMKWNDQLFPISIGSELRNFNNHKVDHFRQTYTFDGDILHGKLSKSELMNIAFQFLNVPYLWGGKSSFGIDCSGFTQQVYKLAGYSLPRDASQQAEVGEVLSFIEEAENGDMAFFENDEGKIIHVGLVFDGNKIIHAHGKVRIDTLDYTGIYNSEYNKHTHILRFIRRLF